MSAYPCDLCKKTKPGKLASAYWAWFTADGSRSAWKVRYCLACAVDALSPVLQRLQQPTESGEVFACVSCGSDASQDSDPVYLTLYLPGRESQEYALQLDGACAAKLRSPITTTGTKLLDRGAESRGRGPSTLTAAWDALGLAPS